VQLQRATTDIGFLFVLPSPGDPDGVSHASTTRGGLAVLGASSDMATIMGVLPLHASGDEALHGDQ
jgi:hypothetical protein